MFVIRQMSRVDFAIVSDGPISMAFLENGISSFQAAAVFIRDLPYRRNSNRDDPFTVFTDRCGTCSTKHALLKRLADENEAHGFELTLGIFRMNGKNTPEVGTILTRHTLDFIPEAHTYLRYGDELIDVTKATPIPFIDDLLDEIEIAPDEITDYKISYHKTFFEEWLMKNSNIPYSIAELWAIREECIKALSA